MDTSALHSSDAVTALLRHTRRIAVLGIKSEAQADRPAYYVPSYLANVGFDVVPVPVYYPNVRRILGRRIYRRLADVPPPPIDLVNIFRRAEDLMPHLSDVIAAHPRVVWLPLGVRNAEFTARLNEANILVIQDLCLMVEVIKRGVRHAPAQASAPPA